VSGMTQTAETYLRTFQELGKKISGKDPAWLKSLRGKALEHFGKAGFPTSKDEAWKYTDLSVHLLGSPFLFEAETRTQTAVAAKLKSQGFEVEKAHLVVFVNGRFSQGLSSIKDLPKGVKLQSLAEVLSDKALQNSFGSAVKLENRAFNALNTAAFADGLFLQVSQGQTVPEPIHAVHLSAASGPATQSHPRNLVVMENDSQAVLIEHYFGDNAGSTFTNAVTEVRLSKGAQLDHSKLQQEDEKGIHIGSLAVKQEEGSRLISRVFSLGGAMARNEVETVLSEKKAECLLEGLYLAKGKQHMDTRTFIDHLSPSCNSQEIFKGVLDGEAVGIFDGRILVRENAQKTDARQSNKNLQLSKESKVYSKPMLQIYADDVKCSHGSATGQLDEEALFYFQSRGIARAEARRMLVDAFAGEMVERIPNDYLKVPLRKMVGEWLGGKS
jgi:Fe-S cluster assembly protein SufD